MCVVVCFILKKRTDRPGRGDQAGRTHTSTDSHPSASFMPTGETHTPHDNSEDVKRLGRWIQKSTGVARAALLTYPSRLSLTKPPLAPLLSCRVFFSFLLS